MQLLFSLWFALFCCLLVVVCWLLLNSVVIRCLLTWFCCVLCWCLFVKFFVMVICWYVCCYGSGDVWVLDLYCYLVLVFRVVAL